MLINWVKAEDIQGKIILFDGTKLNNVTLHIPEFKALGIKRPYYEKLQEKIKYVDPSTRENVYITADKGKEIRFMYDYHEICMVSVSTVSKKPLFPSIHFFAHSPFFFMIRCVSSELKSSSLSSLVVTNVLINCE